MKKQLEKTHLHPKLTIPSMAVPLVNGFVWAKVGLTFSEPAIGQTAHKRG